MSFECEKCREKLDAYLDGVLREDEAREIDEHLGTCQECAKVFDEEKKVVGMLRSLRQRSAPASLREAVLSRLDEKPARTALRERLAGLMTLRRLRVAMELAAVFVVVVAGWYFLQSTRFESREMRAVPNGAHAQRLGTYYIDTDKLSASDMAAEVSKPEAGKQKGVAIQAPAESLETRLLTGDEVKVESLEQGRAASALVPRSVRSEETKKQSLSREVLRSEVKPSIAEQRVVGITEGASPASRQRIDLMEAPKAAMVASIPPKRTEPEIGAAIVPQQEVPPVVHERLRDEVVPQAEEEGTREKLFAAQESVGGADIVQLSVTARGNAEADKKAAVRAVAETEAKEGQNRTATAETVRSVVKQFPAAQVVETGEQLHLGLQREAKKEAAGVSIVVDLPRASYGTFVRKLEEAGLQVRVEKRILIPEVGREVVPAPGRDVPKLGYPAAKASGELAQKQQQPSVLSPARRAETVSRGELVAGAALTKTSTAESSVIRIEIKIGDEE